MFILDYLTSRRPSPTQNSDVPHSFANETVEAQHQQAPSQKQLAAQRSNLPPYLQLYEAPAHVRSRPPPAQGVSPAGGIPSGDATGTSTQSSPQAIPVSEPQQAAAPMSALSAVEASVPEDAVAAAAAPAGPVGLKDCRSRACAGVLDTFKRAVVKGGVSTSSSSSSIPAVAAASALENASPSPASASASSDTTSTTSNKSASTSTTTTISTSSSEEEWPRNVECPPDTWQLGRASWTFLHSVAAHYPQQPTDRQQQLMRGFMEALAEFYPCEVCAEHLREQFRASPPRVATSQELNLWLCGIHNEVNEMLGKPRFDCSRVMERWRDGPADGWCD
ncbi:hypothetical protein Agub_g5514 [Astrephomene gubernaculifera]|uniref:Sulfhydryl oxidase n=1 Tax=Astrephomene gubernaculifera TaxID=47775 RepID=A0AAD3HKP9_9CHLO|nr:hypothetical protein Agub_g5514 [Astrephomene gubernaculifera]